MIINTYSNEENQIQAFNVKKFSNDMYDKYKAKKSKKGWGRNLSNHLKIIENRKNKFWWRNQFINFIKENLNIEIKSETQFVLIFKKEVDNIKNDSSKNYGEVYGIIYKSIYRFVYDVMGNREYVKLYKYKSKKEAIENKEKISNLKLGDALMLKIINENWK